MTIGRVHELRGEAELTLHHAEASMLLAREHGLKEVSLWALTNHAAALSQLGRAEEGLGEIRSYLKTALQIGSRINRTEGVARLAQCLIALGRYDEVFEAAIECIQSDVANGERFYEAELYRMSAECCFRRAEYEDAKARFRRALEIAQNMRARAWELRAAIGLAHVLRKEGHEPEAHQLLAPIYAWYTEGFETRDLRQAKALLNQLASE